MLTVHTDTAVSTPLFTLTRAHETVHKGGGREDSGQRALHSSQSQHTSPN